MKPTKKLHSNKQIKSLFVLTLFAVLSVLVIFSPSWAATYYVDATNGNDNNDGLSQSAAWKTITKVNSSNFSPGDNILFKRGETWNGYLDFRRSGAAGNLITIGAYGSGVKPILTTKNSVSGWDTGDNWVDYSGTIANTWYMNLALHPRRVWLSETEYKKAKNSTDVNSTSRWWWGDIGGANSLLVSASSNPASFYSNVEGVGDYERPLRLRNLNYVMVRNLDLRGGGQALSIQNSDHVIIEYCDIGRDSLNGIHVNGDPSGEYPESDHGIIRYCTIDSGYRFTYDYYTPGIVDGIRLGGPGGANNWEICNNIIRDWGHNAISFDCTDGNYAKGVSYNKAYNNVITAENTSYCRGFTTHGPEGKCQFNDIYHNLIKNTTVRNQINGNNNSFYYNIIDTIRNSIAKSSGSGTAQGIDMQGYGDSVCHDNNVFNNVIYNCEEAGLRLRDEYGPSPKLNNSVINNIVMNCGTKSKDGLMNYGIVIDSGSSVKSNSFRNNCIFSEGVQKVIYYRGIALTVAEFNTTNGQNGDVIMDNLSLDPLLSGVNEGVFLLNNNSPCIDAGIDVGLKEDYRGLPVPAGNRIDIGAFEYFSQVLLPPSYFRMN